MIFILPASGNVRTLYIGGLIFVLVFADLIPARLLLSADNYPVYFGISFISKFSFIATYMIGLLVSKAFKSTDKKKKRFISHFFLTFIIQWLVFLFLGILGEYTIVPLFGLQFISLIPYLPYLTLLLLCIQLFIVYRRYHLPDFVKELKRFFIPKETTLPVSYDHFTGKRVAVIIPTYVPTMATIKLVQSILRWHPEVTIIVVDDSTPLNEKTAVILNKIKMLARENINVLYFRCVENKLKAGALNYGIDYLRLLPHRKPDVVFTFDDDVVINKFTIPEMVNTLFSDEKIGAVCSQVRILNKNKNLLTRMQALEYHSFNITKIADNGFMKGPLVMQGMLTAIRMEVLRQTNGFKIGHLIEDYEMTVRSKLRGWEVRIAQNAVAWTYVPETIPHLWKQRARWISGGVGVVFSFWKSIPAIYQDLYGHLSFILLFSLIVLSYRYSDSYSQTAYITPVLLAISLFNFGLMFIYNAFTLIEYKDKDKTDWILKLTLLPELIYSNLFSVILLGAYTYFVFNAATSALISIFIYTRKIGLLAFNKAGYSTTWGTR